METDDYATSQFYFHLESASTVTFPLLNYNNDTFVGCNKDSEQLFFLAKNAQNYKFVTLYCVRVQ